MKKIALLLLMMFVAAGMYAQGPAYPYFVTLSWSQTGTVTGFNIYRGVYTTACPAISAYTKLNSTPLPLTPATYTDQNPPQGTYCYFATSASAQGESGPSNVAANIAIPAPPPTGFGAMAASHNGVSETTFAWTNPIAPGLTGNKVHCKPPAAKNFAVTLNTSAPVDEVRMPQKTGTYLCEVTVMAKTAESGPSNQATVVVP